MEAPDLPASVCPGLCVARGALPGPQLTALMAERWCADSQGPNKIKTPARAACGLVATWPLVSFQSSLHWHRGTSVYSGLGIAGALPSLSFLGTLELSGFFIVLGVT